MHSSPPPNFSINNIPVPPFSEEALALTFADRHAGELRYVALWNKWLHYGDGRWQFDETLNTYSLARALCREMAAASNKGKTIANAKTRANVISLAREDRRLAATVDQWDRDLWLLNTPGGVIDLRTGKLQPHRIDDYMTKVTAVTATSIGECPKWKEFLATITNNDVELQSYIQRVLGYSLTGLTNEHALFFLYGTGSNGKGVLINTVAGILQDYHKTASQETFTVSLNERHPTELAALRGARLVTVSETEAGKRWSESRIKTLTGGDIIPARFMRQDFFEYTPQFKLMIAGNHRPGLRAVNEAIRRRVNMLPFEVTIKEAQRDKDLAEKLKVEWPGILAWMIEGCLEWQRIGLRPPNKVTEATAEYLQTEDRLGRWLDECCEFDVNAWTSSTTLFMSWMRWTELNGEKTGSQTQLSTDLKEAGYTLERRMAGNGFAGLRLKPTTPFEDFNGGQV